MIKDNKMTLWALTWPIFIEMFLQFLLGAADTLMVSRISDDAVAVVGIANQLFNAVTILFVTIAGGAGVLIAQKLGAREAEDARTTAVLSLKTVLGLGIVMSAAIGAGAPAIARLLQLPATLQPMAAQYIAIVGSGIVFTAATTTLSTIIRSTGNTRGPMLIAIGMNIVHVGLNYVFIYGALGIAPWGLTGVAVSTVVSRLLAAFVLLRLLVFAFERRLEWRDIRLFDRRLFGEVLRIGWPMGVNNGSWVFSQLVIFALLAMLGAKELAARTYMNTMESFCFLLGYSLALAGQIRIAYLYGAGKADEAYRTAYRVAAIGLVLVTANAALLYALGSRVLGWFTADPEIIAIGLSLLALNLILQPGKMINMTLGDALTAVGDTRFLMMVSLIFMWGVAVGASYALGIQAGWGVLGIYAAMIADEYFRGLIAWRRWKGQKFLRRSVKQPAAAPTEAAETQAVSI